jgi:peptidoglycan/LPS O-acetylase OafA/YrhL
MSDAGAASGNVKFIPQLDGLRAFAILPVLLTHSWYYAPDVPISWLGPQGWIGVDLFFVLSGFLITRILIESKGAPRYYLNFYARRGLRVWPVYYLLLFFVFVVCAHLPPHWNRYFPRTLFPAPYFIFYLQNTFFDLPTIPLALAITWSLATEEQFYLLWPFLISRLKETRLPTVLVSIIVATPIIRFFAYPLLGTASNTFFRFDQLAAGALLAWYVRSAGFDPAKLLRLSWAGAALFAASLCVAVYDGRPGLYIDYGYLYLPLALGCVGLIGLALTLPDSSPFIRLLNWRVLRYTGKISYGLYLYHIIAFRVVFASPLYPYTLSKGLAGEGLLMLLQWSTAFAMATVSWYCFESPLLRLKSRFKPPEVAMAPALASSAATA